MGHDHTHEPAPQAPRQTALERAAEEARRKGGVSKATQEALRDAEKPGKGGGLAC